MDQLIRWHVAPNGEALADEVGRRIEGLAWGAIDARGEFRIVLAGGESPRAVYERLAAQPAEWSKWHIYFGDERCLPGNDAARNDTMVRATWLARVGIGSDQVHAIPAELGPEAGARRYGALLRHVDMFDLVLLGLGEDGHTASLFPGHELGQAVGAADVLAIRNAPKPPAARVSLSAARLSRARHVFFLVIGTAKRSAVAAWQAGAAIPASHIRPESGVDVFIDAAAMP